MATRSGSSSTKGTGELMEFLHALADFPFLQNALLGGLLASIGCGVIGPYVVVKRISYLVGGIAHAVLGGVGVAYYFGWPPLGGALVAAVFAALLIGWVSLRWQQQEDMLIGAFWACGMAIGILFISRSPGYNVDLMSYLFGNILLVSQTDLLLMAAVDAVILTLVVVFHRQFLAVCFDEQFARLRGVGVTRYYLLLLCMVALTLVLLIQVVGLILVIALVSLPSAVAGQWVRSLGAMMLLATILGAVLTLSGLGLSYGPDLPSGATIVLLSAVVYLVSTLTIGVRRRWSQG